MMWAVRTTMMSARFDTDNKANNNSTVCALEICASNLRHTKSLTL